MSTHQLTMLRQAARVGEAADLLAVADAAEVLIEAGYTVADTAALLAAVIPSQGNVSAHDRLRQMLDVTRAWTPELLLLARQHGAAWHSLYEPARWWRRGEVEREAVEGFAREFVARTHRWPRPDDMRRRFGKEVGHKGPGDVPGQGALMDEVVPESEADYERGAPPAAAAALRSDITVTIDGRPLGTWENVPSGPEDNAGVYSDADPGL